VHRSSKRALIQLGIGCSSAQQGRNDRKDKYKKDRV
jgi:hypothetical protein